MSKNVKYCNIPNSEERSFDFDHVRIYRDEQITFHRQKTWELSYVITGSGVRVIGDTMESFSSGEVILIPPDIPHCWSFDEFVTDKDGKIENITIVFSDEFLEKCMTTFPELHDPVFIVKQYREAVSFGEKTLMRLRKIMLSMITESASERLASLIKILNLVSSLENADPAGKAVVEDKKAKRLQQIQLYVMNNYQHDITLDEVAGIVGLDRSSFCVFFKKMTGRSFFSFLTEYRIESACHMLGKTGMTASEICFASGFRDVPYYYRMFKRIKNTTPVQYRKRLNLKGNDFR